MHKITCTTCPRWVSVYEHVTRISKSDTWLQYLIEEEHKSDEEREWLAQFHGGMLVRLALGSDDRYRGERTYLQREHVDNKGMLRIPELGLFHEGVVWVCQYCANLLEWQPDKVIGAMNVKREIYVKFFLDGVESNEHERKLLLEKLSSRVVHQ